MHRAVRALGATTITLVLAASAWAAHPAAATASPAEPDETNTTQPDTAASSILDKITDATRTGATSPEELADAVALPQDGAGSLATDADGRLSVIVTFSSRPTDADLAALEAIGAVNRVHRLSPTVDVSVDTQDLDALTAVPGVTSVVPAIRPITGREMAGGASRGLGTAAPVGTARGVPMAPDGASCRNLPVEADGPHRADLAREVYRVDGTGITIGIISDSYARFTDVTTPEEDIAAGLLPGHGNPCGYTTPVRVLDDSQPGTDEGRAMAQLVHGIAPGAEIVFATGYAGRDATADAILDLADAGADIIVDDLGFADEPYYQQSVISLAITQVRDQGVAYYSSAGNSGLPGAEGTQSEDKPISSWQTLAYRGTACPEWADPGDDVEAYDCLDFDPGPDADPTLTFGMFESDPPVLLMSWAEPQYGVTTDFALVAYTTDAEPTAVSQPSNLDPALPVQASGFTEDAEMADYQMVLFRDLTGIPEDEITSPAVWITFFTGIQNLAWLEYDESDGTDLVGHVTYGHSGHGEAVGVAAAPWDSAGSPEAFTSPGPSFLRFAPVDPASGEPSEEYDEFVRVATPSIAGVDDTQTSFFPIDTTDGAHRFSGTSAAAPHVAAIHALAAQYAPEASADEITAAILDSAAGMTNPYPAYLDDADVFGAGLADAYGALAILPTPTVDGLIAEALSATSIAASWDPVSTASGYLVELRADDDLIDTATLADDETALTYVDLDPDTAYTVSVSVLDGEGDAGTAVATSVRTPVPPQPSPLPAPPSPDTLTPDAAGGITASPTGLPADGGTVAITGLPPLSWVAGYLYSTPVSLGWAWTGAAGTASFTIPASVPGGAHRLVVLAADGTVLGWTGLSVAADAAVPASVAQNRGTLSATGPTESPAVLLPAAAVIVLAGAALASVAGKRRRRAELLRSAKPDQYR
ncbi:MAG: S8 family serine peptidase [Microbacterium sp.]|uniref:S8 family serine peptidase n=1 Tax=Microbacterium sp. TaxID=51671 RepID=UPI0032422177